MQWLQSLPVSVQTIGLLVLSNIYMAFAVLYMGEPLKLDYLWAGLCMVGAVYFIFRGG